MLLIAGAKVDSPDVFGNTALGRSVFNYKDDMTTINVLLEYDADPFYENKRGISPSKLAETMGKKELLDIFNRAKGKRP